MCADTKRQVNSKFFQTMRSPYVMFVTSVFFSQTELASSRSSVDRAPSRCLGSYDRFPLGTQNLSFFSLCPTLVT